MPSTPAKWISFPNHRNKKVVEGKHNVLIQYGDASAPNPSGVVLCNPFKWDILYSFLIKNHVVVFVPSTPAKWISFCNHKKRKVVGGTHNVLILYVNASAPNPSGVVLCNLFKWDILLFILIKNHVVVFVPSTTAKWISSRNHRNRNGVGGKHNVLILYVNASAPDPSSVVLWNPFYMRYFVSISGHRGPNNGGFRWVSLFCKYLCGCSCQNWCGIIFQPTVTFQVWSLIGFYNE